MGGGKTFFDSAEDGSSSYIESSEDTPHSPSPVSKGVLLSKTVKGSARGDIDMDSVRKTVETGRGISRKPLPSKAHRSREQKIFEEILDGYKELPSRCVGLEEAKSTILRYTPGSWIQKAGGLKMDDYCIPETTTILLIGPKGSGKSSLINKISKVFEKDKFASERAQVSYNSSVGEGTYFLHEYMVPRTSNAFCLVDTRSISDDPSENMKVLERWMTKGIQHGEPVKRASDDVNVKSRMKYKACHNGKVRMFNFVIMVVNGLSVRESIKGDDSEKTRYLEMIAAAFNSPFLSFKDDKPVVVVTHGDLLTTEERAKVRLRLGKLLGIPPSTQTFDIPDINDPTTEVVIISLLRHCLEHADSNLPLKRQSMLKVNATSLSTTYFLLLVVLAIGIVFTSMQGAHVHHGDESSAPSEVHIDWSKIRHAW